MTGVVFFQNKNVRKIYNSKYQQNDSNLYYVLKNDYITNTRIRPTYSGRKRRATGYVYLNGSPYRDDEGLSQLKFCLHDVIINASPRKGGEIDKFELYGQWPPRGVK